MSKRFEAFYKHWCTYELTTHRTGPELWFKVGLDRDFFNKLKFNPASLKKYRIQAAKRCKKMLGDRPVLCLSGGVDSQAMIQCWQEAKLDFDVAILVFTDGLNAQDVDHARLYCHENNINPIEVKLNVKRFLATESYDLACKYKCNSPHFATHYKLFDLLREQGFTGVCAGGAYPFRTDDRWKIPMSSATINFVDYTEISGFPAMGNFLGYSPELAWTLCMLSTPVDIGITDFNPVSMQELNRRTALRYTSKTDAMKLHGFNIIPQSQKFTGFELVKDYFAKKAGGDGWAFERLFRRPLEVLFPPASIHFIIPNDVSKTLDELYLNQLAAGNRT